MKQTQTVTKRETGFGTWVPILLLIAIVPLIVLAKTYAHGLEQYPWYSTNTTTTDFFLYWKSRMIIILGVVSVVMIAYAFMEKKKENFSFKPMIPLGIYLGFAIISTFFAKDIYSSLFGSTEQFEGLFVILTYGIVCCYGFYFLKSTKDIEILLYGVMAGAGVMGLIGALQCVGWDLYNTDFFQSIMNLPEEALHGQKLKINFAGKSYAALYNPNYMGTYVPLLLPIVIAAAFWFKKLWQKCVLAAIAVLLLISLVGSESVTGFIAIGVSVLVCFVLMLPIIKKYFVPFLIAVGIFVLIAIGVCVVKKDAVEYGFNKIFHPVENKYSVDHFENSDKGLRLVTSEKKSMYIVFNEEGDETNMFTLTDDQGNKIETTYGSKDSTFHIYHGDFSGYALGGRLAQLNGAPVQVFKVAAKDGHGWNFILQDGKYKFLSPFGRIDEIKEIPAIGFEKYQHFASRRGFIWSRTLPLLKDHVIVGSGPDSFILAYPNDDYVGMTNNDYVGQIVSKPHNMYMQIGVQTGIVSLLAFLALVMIYLVSSMKLYWKHIDGSWERIGVGVTLGVVGYMVAGLANDSTITVAPIFWIFLGVGYAINRYVRKERA